MTLYANQGAIQGTLEVTPSPPSGLAGFSIYAQPGQMLTTTDAAGQFAFRALSEPERSNNWGVPVYGDGSGPGTATYTVGVSGSSSHETVTVNSSQLSTASLSLKYPPCEDPDMRCHRNPQGPSPGPDSAGRPVSVVTGNVYFDQTDTVVAGIAGLEFSRSYNSLNAYRGHGSGFTEGWTHSYARSISVLEAGILTFRGDDGVPFYYQDKNADLTYEVALPATDESWIVQSAGGYVRHQRSGGTESYDTSGRLVSVTDDAGRTITLGRDASGRLSTITDASGRALTLTYGAANRIVSLSGPTGALAFYEYDQSSRLSKVAYPDGSGYSFITDSNGYMLRVEDLSGRLVESHAYDSQGRGLTSEIGETREKLTFVYDPTNHKTTVTDALGNVTTYHWKIVAGLRQVTKVEGSCHSCGSGGGTSQEWIYDAKGRVLSHKNALGQATTYEYDSIGDLIAEVDPLNKTTTYTRDAQGRILTTTRPDGGTTTYTHGSAGPLTITEKVTASQSRTTTMTYNSLGKPETIADPRGKVTTLAYNTTTGDLVSVSDPLSHATTFGYDGLGRRTTVTDALNHTTTTAYDARGRVTKITNHDGTFTEFAYDQGGRRTKVTDPMGRATRYAYDDYGRLGSVLDALNGETRYGYDLMGNLTSLTDAKGQTSTFEYDSYSRVKKVIYPGGAFESFTYDLASRLSTKTDRKDVTTTYSYDSVGRLLGKTYSDGTTPAVTYTYDFVGRLLTAANGTDTLTWTYDLAGQLLTEQSTKNSSTVAYTYDNGGNRATVSLDGSLFVTYGYDDASRLTSITRGSNVFGFGYDNANRRTSMTYPNGVNTAYTYDNLNRLLRLKADKGATPITDFQYVYDNAGNRTRKQQLDYTEDYTYDPLYRLTGATRSAGGTGLWQWSYDAVGNRLTNQLDNTVSTSTYNEKNQLTSSTGGGPLRWRGSLNEPGNVTFTSALVNGKPARMLQGNVFEALLDMSTGNNTVTVQATDVSGNVTTKNYQVNVSGPGATYTYDPNGNLTQKVDGADTWGYEWNAENQLTRVTKNSVEQARFKYDPKGRRVEKIAGGNTVTWAYDGEGILRQVAGAATLKYIHGPGLDEPVASDDGTSLTSFQQDGLGSVVKTASSTGAITLTRQYDAWGVVQAGTTSAGYAFTGREWDPEAVLHYYRARYYDPRAGRFISEDPIGFAGGPDFYVYVSNGPVASRDPLGLFMVGGPYETGCALVIGLYYGRAGKPMGWPWTHCMASCKIARHCGPETQVVFGFAKEAYDTVLCLTGRRDSCRSSWQPSDFTNNYEGATAPCQMSCEQACGHLKNIPDPPSGPFGDGPWSWY